MDLLTTCTFRFLICSAVSDYSYWTESQTDLHTISGLLDLRPIQLGVEVRGINLDELVSNDVIEELKKVVHKHRLVLFRNQTEITGDRHIEIARWFGEIDKTFPNHPKSPALGVFRLSNDWNQGHKGVGISGWHIDGSILEKPSSFALYHMVVAARTGDTGTIQVELSTNHTSSDVCKSNFYLCLSLPLPLENAANLEFLF